MKLWLLDADVIIDLIRLEIFDKLAALHEISAASTVIDEVKFYVKHGVKVPIPFRGKYVDTGTVREVSAEPEELAEALNRVPEDQRSVIHGGELESMAVLVRRDDLVFCSCDAAPYGPCLFSISPKGVFSERLLKPQVSHNRVSRTVTQKHTSRATLISGRKTNSIACSPPTRRSAEAQHRRA